MAYPPKRIHWRISCMAWAVGETCGNDSPPLEADSYRQRWQRTYLERHYQLLAQTLRQAADWLVFSYSVSQRQTP